MRGTSWARAAKLLGIALVLLALPVLGACGGDGGGVEPTATPAPQVNEFEVVQDAVADYLADFSGSKNGINLAATDLYAVLNDGDDDNDPYIASLRSAADYAKGHIPGAVNIAFGDLTTLPKGEDILVYCYTGQTASMATAILGTLGYDVQNLLHGMSSWTTDAAVYVKRFDAATAQSDYTVETTANDATATYDYPDLDNTASSNDAAILEAAAESVTTKYISATDLYGFINDGDDDTTPFIIDLRAGADYTAGHVPGAVNMGIGSLASNLNKIPADQTVVLYCYTGHTAGQATALLNMLGYDAKSLSFGFCSWSSTATKCFDATTAAHDYATATE